MATNSDSSRVHRSSTECVIAGVCGGLAEYFEVDPSLVRVAFVVATLWSGLGLLLYVILAIVLPVDPDAALVTVPRPERSRNLAAVVLILLGALLLAGNVGWAPWLTWQFFWPTVLVVVGGALVLRSKEVST